MSEEVEEDLLADLDGKLQDPGEGAKKAGEKLEEKPADDDSKEPEDGDNDNADGETEDKPAEDDEDELTLQDKHDYLKTEVGRQGQEIGDLKKQIKEGEKSPPAEPVVDPLKAKLEAATKLYGPELVQLIQEVAAAKVAPLQQTQGLQSLRERFPDFDEVRADMDKIFEASPSLRTAVETDVTVLDTVYKAAKAERGDTNSSEQAQKDEARRKKVSSQKDAAYMEKPSGRADAPKKVTQKEQNAGFVGSLISSLKNDPS